MASMEQIANLINDCWHYFKVSSPPPKTIESWASELLDLDLYNSGPFISRRFKLLPDFPKNFPVAIRVIYKEWRNTQPVEAEKPEGCPSCMEGEGLIHAWKQKGKYWYPFTFRCSHCRTSKQINYQEVTREWLEHNEYILDWNHDFDGETNRGKVYSFKNSFGQIDQIPF